MKRTNQRDLLIELIKTNFKLKYRGSILGFLWVLLKPFMQFTILYIVFSASQSEVTNFPIFLLLGLIIFSFTQESINSGTLSLLDKTHIILKVNFDKRLAVFSSIALALINFVINLIIVLIFITFNPITTNLAGVLYAAFIFFTLLVLVNAIAFFTSVLAVKVRDLLHIIEVTMLLLFYASGIFFDIAIVPEPFKSILQYNPIHFSIQAIREAIIHGQIIYESRILILLGISIVLFFLGTQFFKKQVVKIAEYF